MTKHPLVVTEIRLQDFGMSDAESLGRIQLVSVCSDPADRQSAQLWRDVLAMPSNDQKETLMALRMLLKLAQIGKPFNLLLPSGAVHPAFAPLYCGASKKMETVWRYRHGHVRILFFYAADKVVLLTHAVVKRKPKLTGSQISGAKQAVEHFVAAVRGDDGLRWIE